MTTSSPECRKRAIAMASGFGRKFWIQLIFDDGDRNESKPPEWIPWNDTYESAQMAAGVKMIANPEIAYALILDGTVKQGTECVPKRKILADVSRELVKGAKKLAIVRP